MSLMKNKMTQEWFKYVDAIGELVLVARNYPEISDQAKDIISRVLFYANKEQESLDWLL